MKGLGPLRVVCAQTAPILQILLTQTQLSSMKSGMLRVTITSSVTLVLASMGPGLMVTSSVTQPAHLLLVLVITATLQVIQQGGHSLLGLSTSSSMSSTLQLHRVTGFRGPMQSHSQGRQVVKMVKQWTWMRQARSCQTAARVECSAAQDLPKTSL